MAMNQIASWGTAYQRLLYDLDHATSPIDAERAKVALIDAINNEKYESYPFNTESVAITAVADKSDYDMATYGNNDVFRILGVRVSNGLRTWDLNASDRAEVQRLIDGQQVGEGPTDYYFEDDTLYVGPATPSTDYTITYRAVVDVGTPRYGFTSGAWSFLDENGATISDSWTSPWLKEAGLLVLHLAMAEMSMSYYDDDEKAERFERMAALDRIRLRDQFNSEHDVRVRTPWGW